MRARVPRASTHPQRSWLEAYSSYRGADLLSLRTESYNSMRENQDGNARQRDRMAVNSEGVTTRLIDRPVANYDGRS